MEHALLEYQCHKINVELKHVSYILPLSDRRLLDDISINFRAGESTLVIAPPSSEKTLLLNAISGRLECNFGEAEFTGHVYYNGVNIQSLKSNLSSHVSFVEQQDNHYELLSV